MKEKEEIKTQRGIYNLPGNVAFPNDKVLKLFTKLKRKAKKNEKITQSPAGDGTPLRDLEPNLQELQLSAMNSYRLRSDVNKTDAGFEAAKT